jgi:hypothetical protein
MGAIRRKRFGVANSNLVRLEMVNIGGATQRILVRQHVVVWRRLLCSANSLGRKLSRIDQPRTKEIVAKANFATMARDSLVFEDDGYPQGVRLPNSPSKWKKQAILHKLAGGSISDLDEYVSASKIGYKQFLHLRTLWIAKKANILANDDTRRIWLGDAHYSEARNLLRSWSSWEAYLGSFEVSLGGGSPECVSRYRYIFHDPIPSNESKGIPRKPGFHTKDFSGSASNSIQTH